MIGFNTRLGNEGEISGPEAIILMWLKLHSNLKTIQYIN